MKKTLEKLGIDYLSDECAEIDTDEERFLTEELAKLHKKASASLNEGQREAVDQYVNALCDLEALFAKKAFFKGCEFSISFLLEAGDFKK